MKKYKLFYWKYNIKIGKYEFCENIIETNDIFHEIGKLVYNSFEHIKGISFKELDNDN